MSRNKPDRDKPTQQPSRRDEPREPRKPEPQPQPQGDVDSPGKTPPPPPPTNP